MNTTPCCCTHLVVPVICRLTVTLLQKLVFRGIFHSSHYWLFACCNLTVTVCRAAALKMLESTLKVLRLTTTTPPLWNIGLLPKIYWKCKSRPWPEPPLLPQLESRLGNWKVDGHSKFGHFWKAHDQTNPTRYGTKCNTVTTKIPQ